MDKCVEWLRFFLVAYGRVEVGIIRDVRKTLGFTRAEVNSAKRELGVIVENDSNGFQSAGRWFWRLP